MPAQGERNQQKTLFTTWTSQTKGRLFEPLYQHQSISEPLKKWVGVPEWGVEHLFWDLSLSRLLGIHIQRSRWGGILNLDPQPEPVGREKPSLMWRQTPRSKHSLSSSVTGWTGSVTCKSSLSRSALLKTSPLRTYFLERGQGSLEIHPIEWKLSRQSSRQE